MAFSMFSGSVSPIAIDFGSSSAKLIQLSTGDRPSLVAAARLPIPVSMAGDPARQADFLAEQIPVLLRDGGFKSKRIVCAVPSAQAHIQHMRLLHTEGVSRDAQVKGQLQLDLGCSPESVVVRSIEVGDFNRDGEVRTEVICLAVAKQLVMRLVDVLRRCKLEVVGVHTEPIAIVRSFDHLSRREGDDEITTMFVDVGFSATRFAVAHGARVRFARVIPFGGRSLDQLVAKAQRCDVQEAHAQRMAISGEQPVLREIAAAPAGSVAGTASAELESGGGKGGVAVATERRTRGSVPPELRFEVPRQGKSAEIDGVNMTEMLDTFRDELAMCERYHRGLYGEREIDQLVFIGGESRQMWLCREIARDVEAPAYLGDPAARLNANGVKTPGVDFSQPLPGWAVAIGLCSTPTDL